MKISFSDLATVDSVHIVSTTFHSAEGFLNVSLNEEDLQSYPYVKLMHTKMPVPEKVVFDDPEVG